MKRTLLTGALALALSLGLSGIASAETFSRTLTLGGNMAGDLTLRGVNVGDEVNLTLVNPTSQDLVFHTDAAIGSAESWTVPANSQRVINFTYTVPFSDDVSFDVRDASGASIAQGLLFDIDEGTLGNDNELNQDVFRQSITLQPGMGEIVMDDLGVGDRVQLTLVNPTSQPLTFSTTEQLGPEATITVPANGTSLLSFDYTRPFDDDVEYQVTSPAGTIVSQGVLIQSQQVQQTRQTGTQVQPERSTTVRGFW